MYSSVSFSDFKDKSEYQMEFYNLDKNNDGQLNFEELVEAFINNFNLSFVEAEKHVSSIFESLDKNKNGSIDYTEFVMGTCTVGQVIT